MSAKNTTVKVKILRHGDPNYHLRYGDIDCVYTIDKNKEFASCWCGRLLHYIEQIKTNKEEEL